MILYLFWIEAMFDNISLIHIAIRSIGWLTLPFPQNNNNYYYNNYYEIIHSLLDMFNQN